MRFVLEILIIGLLFNSGYGKPAARDDADYPSDDDEPRETGNPVITTLPQEIVAQPSAEVLVPCVVINNDGDDFSIAWDFNNQKLYVSKILLAPISPTIYSLDNSTNSLRINRFESNLAGNYTCYIPVKPGVGITHVVGLKQPVVIESITGKKVLDNMAELSLTCRAKGFPTPTISWSRKSSENAVEQDLNSRSANFVISAATFTDSGIYICKADNGDSSEIRTFSVNVINGVAPESTKVYASQTESTKLCCVFDKPRKLNWLMEGKEVPKNDRYDFEEEKHKTCLVIKKVKEEDLGQYTCATDKNAVEHANIDLIGTPAKPVTKLISTNEESKNPFITWSISSLVPISEYKVWTKKAEENEWKELERKTLAAEDKKDEITYTFSNLANGRYSVKLEVTNKYGTNESIENGGIVVDRYEPNVVMSAKINSGAEHQYRISSLCVVFVILMRLWSC